MPPTIAPTSDYRAIASSHLAQQPHPGTPVQTIQCSVLHWSCIELEPITLPRTIRREHAPCLGCILLPLWQLVSVPSVWAETPPTHGVALSCHWPTLPVCPHSRLSCSNFSSLRRGVLFCILSFCFFLFFSPLPFSPIHSLQSRGIGRSKAAGVLGCSASTTSFPFSSATLTYLVCSCMETAGRSAPLCLSFCRPRPG